VNHKLNRHLAPRLLALCIPILTAATAATTAAATTAAATTAALLTQHPFHATSLELDWNPDSHCFEAALQLPAATLHEELTRVAGRPVNLDHNNPEIAAKNEQLLQDWIRSRLKITAANLPNCEIQWVGSEFENRSLWAYFEIRLLPPPKQSQLPQTAQQPAPDCPTQNLTIHCSFFQHLPGQVNAATVRTPKQRGSTLLTDAQLAAPVLWSSQTNPPLPHPNP
jgi:hypothetical protein